MKKAIVAKKDIKKGEKLSLDNLWFKRTEQQSYIQQQQFLQLIGLEAAEDIRADDLIDFTKVTYRFTQRDLREFTHTK
jgi:sialic acid synthase SpsE